MKVLDSHHHSGNLVVPFTVDRTLDRPDPWEQFDESEYRQRLAMMDAAGVDMAVVMPVNRYIAANGVADTRRVNDAIARYRDHDPARFVAALGVAEPLHGDAGLEEVRRLRSELGLVGVSYHSRWQGVATNDPWMLRHIELLGELQMIACVHAHADSNLEAPAMVGQVARTLPDVPILVMDAMSSSGSLMQFIDIAERCPNVYLETSLLANLAALRKIVAVAGAERIVFGTDTYSGRMLTRNTPAAITELGLPDESLALILHDNMERLLAWAGCTVPIVTDDRRR